MADLRIDNSNETVYPPVFATGEKETSQRAIIRLEVFKGEWPFDNEAGIDWYLYTESKEQSPTEIGAAIKEELEKVPGLASIDVQVAETGRYDIELEFEDDVESQSLSAEIGGMVDGN